MEELRRQAGWAKTFGLPLELISADEAKEMFPLMSTEGVLGAAWLPTDGYLDPSQLTFALADGARQGGCRTFTNTRVTGIEVDGRPRRARSRPSAGESRPRSSSTRAACSPPRSGGWRASASRCIPMSHQYLVTQPFRERDPENPLPTLRDPDLLIYYREEGGGLVMGGYERHSEPAFMPDGTDRLRRRSRPTSTAACSRTTGTASRRSSRTRGRRVPAMDEVTVTRADQRARGLHPRQRVLPGRDRGARASSSPPASAPTGSPARAASAR